MDARSSVQWIVVLLVIMEGISPPVFAGTVYTYDGDFDLPIPKLDSSDPDISKGWMDDAVIEITDRFIVSDLDVRVSITHTNVFDLQIFLQSPAGTRICLNMYTFREFFEGANYTQTVFDDDAELSIKQAEPPFTGSFRPVEPYELSGFDGEDTYGIWRLQIYDAWDWDTGTLDSFELFIITPEPATAIFLILGASLVNLFKTRRCR
ncbi:MAG: proprotein convertase P-domain-containing protein [Planctomycetota bacterium]|jgi:subtilisin-like proprotein convertase family protein